MEEFPVVYTIQNNTNRSEIAMNIALKRLITNYIFKPHMGKRFLVIVGDHVSKEIVNSGCYERPLIKFLIKNKHILNANGQGTFIDVGANIGNHSIMLSEYFNTVISVEPNTFCAKCIELNAELNNIENISVVEVGLGTQQAKMRLIIPTNDFSSGYISDNTAGTDTSVQEVDVITLNNLEKRVGKGVSFVKIDAEGMERDIIDSGDVFFKSHQPLVAFEAHGKDKYCEVKDVLLRYEYKFFYKLTQSRRLFKSRLLNIIAFSLFPDYVKVELILEPSDVNYQMVLASVTKLDLR
jgi:FkbM family methyltransferase